MDNVIVVERIQSYDSPRFMYLFRIPYPSRHMLAIKTGDEKHALRKLSQDFAEFFTNPEIDDADATAVRATFSPPFIWKMVETSREIVLCGGNNFIEDNK